MSFVFAFILVISLSVFASLPSTPPSESDGGMYALQLKTLLTGSTTLGLYYALPGSLTVRDADTLDGLDATAFQRKFGTDCASGSFLTSVQVDGTLVCNGAATMSGSCGTANGTTIAAYPNGTSACASGLQGDVDTLAADGSYNWKCDTIACSATKLLPVGICGTGARAYAWMESSYGATPQCSLGSPTNTNFPIWGGTENWVCTTAGGDSPTCTATRSIPYDGICGTANGKTFPDAQTDVNPYTLCANGGASQSVFPAGSLMIWSCRATMAGFQDAPCQAYRATASQAGSCDNSVALGCSVGSPINDNNQTACNTTRTWNCSGVNSGATSPQCSLNNASCSAGNCMVTNETWGAGCSANAPSGQSIVNGGTAGPFTIANTAPGYTGSASFLCWDSEPTALITAEWAATNISCSPVAPVPQAGSCNNSMSLGCSVGSPINDNNQTACNTTRTWNCDGVNSGPMSPQCSFNNGACGCVSAPSPSQSIACSTAASLGYTAPGNTAGTAYYQTETAACKPNFGQVIWTDVSGCTPPACVSTPSSTQSIACSAVAGSYGIPATYTQGTAFYKTENALCKVNYGQVIWTDITGCSPPAAVVNGQCGNDYQCIVGNPQNFSNPISSLPSRTTVTWDCVGSGPGHTNDNCTEMTGQVKDPNGPQYLCGTPGKVVRTLGSGCFYSEDLIYPNAGYCYEAFCD